MRLAHTNTQSLNRAVGLFFMLCEIDALYLEKSGKKNKKDLTFKSPHIIKNIHNLNQSIKRQIVHFSI